MTSRIVQVLATPFLLLAASVGHAAAGAQAITPLLHGLFNITVPADANGVASAAFTARPQGIVRLAPAVRALRAARPPGS